MNPWRVSETTDGTHPGCGPIDEPAATEDQREAARKRQLGGLRPRRKGDPPLNPEGKNGHRKRQELIASILNEEDDDSPLEDGCSRIRSVVLASVKLAKSGEPGAAAAQKTCMEFFAGKPRQQVDVTSDDEKLSFANADEVAAAAIALIEAQSGSNDDGNPTG